MVEIKIDLYGDFSDAVRRQMASQGYDIASITGDNEAAIRSYARLNRRIIAPQPRQILKASSFDPSNHEVGIAKLETAVRNGESLTPYMSSGSTSLK